MVTPSSSYNLINYDNSAFVLAILLNATFFKLQDNVSYYFDFLEINDSLNFTTLPVANFLDSKRVAQSESQKGDTTLCS